MVEDLSWCIAATVILVMLPIDGTFTVAIPYALLYSMNEVGWLVLSAAVDADTNMGIMLMSKASKRRNVIAVVLVFSIFFILSFSFGYFLSPRPYALGARG